MPLPAATTRSPGGTLCEAPLYVLLKHPSRRRSDPWGFVLGRWVAARALGALGVGCAAGSPRGRWVLRWVFQGGDDEVHRPDTLRGVSGRSPEAPPAPASRLAEAHFWALGVWALGVWALGVWALGVGRWVRGRVAPGGSGRRQGHFAKVPMDRMKAHTERIVAVYSLLVYWEYWRSYSQALGVLGVGCWALGVGRWVLGVGCWALGVRQGRPGVQRLRGRWVALPPPVSRGPGRYPSSRRPRPRRRPPPRRRRP